MRYDLMTLNALSNELSVTLKGARVEKIFQPEDNEIRLVLKTASGSHTLVLSARQDMSTAHITKTKKTNPFSAPAFCMLLRKHLQNARLENVSIFNLDRTLQFQFSAKNELNDLVELRIYAELMGRYSNIILTDGNDIIIDAVKRLPFDGERKHSIFKGLRYEAVEQPKKCVFSVRNEDFIDFVGKTVFEFIQNNFSGFSKNTLSKLLQEANIDKSAMTLNQDNINKLIDTVRDLQDIFISKSFNPSVLNDEIISYKIDENSKSFATLSEAFDYIYSQNDNCGRIKSRTKHLTAAINRMSERVEKRLLQNAKSLEECNDMEKFKRLGELVISNIYKIKRGDKVLKTINYESGNEVEIALDEKLSPSKCADKYFTKYNKLKRTKAFLEKKNEEDKELLEYLKSIKTFVENLGADDDISQIESELQSIGALTEKKQTRNNDKRQKPQPPIRYEFKDFTILKGRNNIQNEELTFKIASSKDIWFHIKDGRGAHAVILTQGRKVSDEVIQFAAEIAAFSKDFAASVQVDYTERRNVKRKPSAHIGQVIYTDFKTILVIPNEHKQFLKP